MTAPVAPRPAVTRRVTQIVDEFFQATKASTDTSAVTVLAERLATAESQRDTAVTQVATYAAQALDLIERLEKAEAQIADLTRQRDKWLEAFNRSEPFQDGPTKREAALRAALEKIAEAHKPHGDRKRCLCCGLDGDCCWQRNTAIAALLASSQGAKTEK